MKSLTPPAVNTQHNAEYITSPTGIWRPRFRDNAAGGVYAISSQTGASAVRDLHKAHIYHTVKARGTDNTPLNHFSTHTPK